VDSNTCTWKLVCGALRATVDVLCACNDEHNDALALAKLAVAASDEDEDAAYELAELE